MAMVERERQPDKVGCLRADGETVFVGIRMQNYLKEKGIRLQCSAWYRHDQNGIAERKIKTVQEMARTFMMDAAAPPTD